MTRPDVGLMVATLLPTPVRVFWVLVMVALLVLFARRALSAHGERRLWYAVYVLVSAAMAVMFALNPMVSASPAGVAVLVIVGATALALAGWMVVHRDDEGLTLPWVLPLVDLVIVAYIQVPSPSRPVLVCSAMAAYLAVLTIARVIGAFRARREPDLAAGEVSGLVGATVGPALPDETRSATTNSRTARSTVRTAGSRSARASVGVGPAVPGGVAVLTLAMFYMISI